MGAKALADADSSDFLGQEVASAMFDLRSELLQIAPAVKQALAQMDGEELS